ncbi:hypothetical protein PMAYCL1PPCAC_17411, partial [Pristionchus mayeri]
WRKIETALLNPRIVLLSVHRLTMALHRVEVDSSIVAFFRRTLDLRVARPPLPVDLSNVSSVETRTRLAPVSLVEVQRAEGTAFS